MQPARSGDRRCSDVRVVVPVLGATAGNESSAVLRLAGKWPVEFVGVPSTVRTGEPDSGVEVVELADPRPRQAPTEAGGEADVVKRAGDAVGLGQGFLPMMLASGGGASEPGWWMLLLA